MARVLGELKDYGKQRPSTSIGLMSLCKRHNLHLISDEVYALSVYDTSREQSVPFTSVLSFKEDEHMDREMVHVLYSMSKDFAAAGIRIAMMHTRNQQLLRAMISINQFHWSGAVLEKLAAQILEHEAWITNFVALSKERLLQGNALIRRILNERVVPYLEDANAGFFVWADFGKFLGDYGDDLQDGWRREGELLKAAMERKVYITPGSIVAAERPGFFRITFSQEPSVIEEGMKRVFEAVEILQPGWRT
ncbi:MAG: hypothetical protein Q9165_004144 [Trypethelium subeluteriae]